MTLFEVTQGLNRVLCLSSAGHFFRPPSSMSFELFQPPILQVNKDLSNYMVIVPKDTVHCHISKVNTGLSGMLLLKDPDSNYLSKASKALKGKGLKSKADN